MPPKFKVGDIVSRNHVKFIDAETIPLNSVGKIIHIFRGYEDNPLYAVAWEEPIKGTYQSMGHYNTWNIYETCINFFDQSITSEERKLNRIITKIKELDERFAKSRTVSTQMGNQKSRESTTSTTGDQPVSAGVESLEGRILNAVLNAHSGLYAAISSPPSSGRTYSLSTSDWFD